MQLSKVEGSQTYDYYYNNAGKLSKIIWTLSNGSTAKPTYLDAPFTVTYSSTNNGTTEKETLTINTTASGLVKSYTSVQSQYDNQGSTNGTLTETVECTYNASDQLTSMVINQNANARIGGSARVGTYYYKFDLTWEDGNLKKCTLKQSENGTEKAEQTKDNFYYSSTDNAAKMMGIAFFNSVFGGYIESSEIYPLIPFGIFGKGPAKLPYGCNLKNDGTLRSDGAYTYKYSNDD
ncbi:MAG: hypothetical protein IJ700_00950 [Bacteroidaceae bacterium]|nr:hypothetical protein [Bacteroidaceae bacterium]